MPFNALLLPGGTCKRSLEVTKAWAGRETANGDPNAIATVRVSLIDFVSPRFARWTVTAGFAPMSTAYSALWAKCVRPSFIVVTLASRSLIAASRSQPYSGQLPPATSSLRLIP